MSTAGELATATGLLADEAATVTQLLAQYAGGDANAVTILRSELPNAVQMRADFVARFPDLDTTIIDLAIREAQAVVGGGGTTSLFTPTGLRLGRVVIPWPAVAAIVALGLYLWYESRKRRH